MEGQLLHEDYSIIRWVSQVLPAPMAHSYRLGLVTWGYQVRIPVGTDICHRGCAYTVLQTVQRHGVYSAAYGTVHYKEPLKSFEIRVGHSPGFGLPPVAILPWLCRKRRKAIFIHSIPSASSSMLTMWDHVKCKRSVLVYFGNGGTNLHKNGTWDIFSAC